MGNMLTEFNPSIFGSLNDLRSDVQCLAVYDLLDCQGEECVRLAVAWRRHAGPALHALAPTGRGDGAFRIPRSLSFDTDLWQTSSELNLWENSITSLPAGAFDGLARVRYILATPARQCR